MLDGKVILWDHFIQAYNFNNETDLHLYRQLSKSHIYPTQAEKMRNHLSTQVLDGNMLNLFRVLQTKIPNPNSLASVIKLLEHTSNLIEIFSTVTSTTESTSDSHIHKLLSILDFFHTWENQFPDKKDQGKRLITKETHQDIDSCIYGFLHIVIGPKS